MIREDRKAEQSSTVAIAGPFFLRHFNSATRLISMGPQAASTAELVKRSLLEQVGE